MRLPSKEQIEALRKEYPAGTRIELLAMADEQAPPPGTLGTVIAVDDAGSLVTKWDNGSGRNVLPDAGDRIKKQIMTEDVFNAIQSVRAGGRSNMLDLPAVQRLAYEAGYYGLVLYIADHPREYFHFILYGREP